MVEVILDGIEVDPDFTEEQPTKLDIWEDAEDGLLALFN